MGIIQKHGAESMVLVDEDAGVSEPAPNWVAADHLLTVTHCSYAEFRSASLSPD